MLHGEDINELRTIYPIWMILKPVSKYVYRVEIDAIERNGMQYPIDDEWFDDLERTVWLAKELIKAEGIIRPNTKF